MMPDWKEYRARLVERVQDLGKLTPETVRGYAALGQAGTKTQQLDPATRELHESGTQKATDRTFRIGDQHHCRSPDRRIR